MSGGDSTVAALCRAHGYPPEVREILDQVVAALRPLEPHGVLLHGSTARGELTWWRDEAGRVRLGSDMEMYVAGRAPFPAAARAGAEAALEALAARVDGGGQALFHVDVAFMTLEELRRHPRTFRAWDTRETGWPLLGADVRAELPALGPGDLDLRQLNEVPIHRLWEMVFRFPRALLDGGAGGDGRVWGVVCARQALDLTTWLLPHFGVLVPTFGRRVALWGERFAELPLARWFAPDSADFLRECLHAKLRLELAREPRQMHARVLEQFRAALRLLLGAAPDAPDAELAAAIARDGRRHWNSPSPRRRAYEAYLVLRDRPSPARGARWWRAHKPSLQVAALLWLNASLEALLAGAPAEAPLRAAEDAMARLWYGFRPAGGAPAARFLALRRGYLEYLTGTSRWFGPRRDYLLHVIES